MLIPRNEHPNPQWMRKNWLNLNGTWEFEIDNGKSGRDRKFYLREELSGEILVPFCPESPLSGVNHKDFMNAVWYRREINLPKEWQQGCIFLHFGAVDYEAYVYVNGQLACTHRGGFSSFEVQIDSYLKKENNYITVCAIDDSRNPLQPRGKQSEGYFSDRCDYTRVTGIWQTVWLEYRPQAYIKNVKYYPNIEDGSLLIETQTHCAGILTARAFYEGRPVGQAQHKSEGGFFYVKLDLDEIHLWEVGKGRLYDLVLTYGEDEVSSYFGLRSLRLDGYRFLINEDCVFQRLVLDQGYYPDGIYTAPSEEAFIKDIEISLAAGFNGARLHQKIFEPRFLYHCDKMGYIVWGEHGNWGLDYSDPCALPGFLSEWTEALNRDFNHPAIVGWCPFNETWDYENKPQKDNLLSTVYSMTKQLDPTRPCIDTSGHFHTITDIFDIHDYEQDPEIFKAHYDRLMTHGELFDPRGDRQAYHGEPTFLSEYGGIQWDIEKIGGWGYGNGPASEEEFLLRYQGLTDALLDNDKMFGFCYTQLYDVEQEVNGLYTYGRIPKFDMEIIKNINIRKAKIEEEYFVTLQEEYELKNLKQELLA